MTSHILIHIYLMVLQRLLFALPCLCPVHSVLAAVCSALYTLSWLPHIFLLLLAHPGDSVQTGRRQVH